MGIWDDLEEIGISISGGEPMYKLLKKVRRLEVSTSLVPYRGEIIAALGKIDSSLAVSEHLTEFTRYQQGITLARQKIGEVRRALQMAKLESAMATLDEIQELRTAIIGIGNIDSRTDPVGAGRAWGAAIGSIGRLAQNLPPPASSLGVLLENLGEWFHKVVADLVPHERESWKREVDLHKRGGVDISK